jgi:hypothetical protein
MVSSSWHARREVIALAKKAPKPKKPKAGNKPKKGKPKSK